MQTAVLAFALALIVQAGTLLYWAGELRQVVKRHDGELGDHEKRIRGLELKRRQGDYGKAPA